MLVMHVLLRMLCTRIHVHALCACWRKNMYATRVQTITRASPWVWLISWQTGLITGLYCVRRQ